MNKSYKKEISKKTINEQISPIFRGKDLEEIKEFMEQEGSMCWETAMGRNPLHVAAYLGLPADIINFLVEKASKVGFDFDAVDNDKKNAIEIAYEAGNHDTAKAIIKALFLLKPTRFYGANFCTVIHLAALYDYTDVADFVADCIANNKVGNCDLKKMINCSNVVLRLYPLEMAIDKGSIGMAKWLINKGSLLKEKSEDAFEVEERSFLDEAISKYKKTEKKGFVDIIGLMLGNSSSPLDHAIDIDDMKLVRLLLRHGAPVEKVHEMYEVTGDKKYLDCLKQAENQTIVTEVVPGVVDFSKPDEDQKELFEDSKEIQELAPAPQQIEQLNIEKDQKETKEQLVRIRHLYQLKESIDFKENVASAPIEKTKEENVLFKEDQKKEESWTSSIARIFSMASTLFLGNVVGDMLAQKQVSKPLLFGGVSAFLLTHVAELVTKDKKTSCQEQIKKTWLGKTVGFGVGVAVPVLSKLVTRCEK